MEQQQQHILLIDQNEQDYMTIRQLLAYNGSQQFILKWIDSFEAALEDIKYNFYDLYLIDDHLGEHTGLELLQHVNQNACTSPIILLGSQNNHQLDINAMRAGAADYLVKDQLNAYLLERAIRYAIKHKRVEETLRENETHLRQVLSSVTTHIYVTEFTANSQPLNRYISPNVESLIGYPPEKLKIDWTFWTTTLVHPDDRLKAANQFKKFLEKQDSEVEYRLIRADSSIIWVHDSGRVKIDPTTQLITVYGVVNDITKRKQAEKTQELYAQRLKVLNKIDQAILAAESSQAIAQVVIKYIRQLIPCHHISITLFDFEINEAIILASYAQNETQLKAGQHIPLNELKNIASLQKDQHNIIANLSSLTSPSGIDKQLLAEGIHSMISAPLISRGALIGALNLGAMLAGTFNSNHLEIIRQIADQLAVAILQTRLYEAEAQRRREAEAFRDIAAALNSTLNLEEVMERILANIGRVVSHDTANIMLIEADDAYVVRHQGYEKYGLLEQIEDLRLSISNTFNLRQMVETSQPLAISDTHTHSGWVKAWDYSRSYAGAPICSQGEVMGFLSLDSVTPGFFSPTQARQLQVFANQAAVALKNAHLHTETQRRTQELATLNKAGQAMTSALDLDVVLHQTMSQANALLKTESAAVLLSDPLNDILVFSAVAAIDAAKLLGQKMPLGAGIAGWAIEKRQSVLVNDVQSDLRFYNSIDAISQHTTRSLVAVPLIYKEKVIGVIEATNKIKGNFNEHDLEMLESLTNSAAIAIENARLFGEVRVNREQLRHLAQQLVSAQEKERQRLSHELHDEAGQALTALKIGLELIQVDLPTDTDNIGQRLGDAIELTDTAMEQLRALARGLRPPGLDKAGLTPTLESLCHNFTHQTQLTVDYISQGLEPASLPDSIGICIYRFLQEALTNIAKHAQATYVEVTLHYTSKNLTLYVVDDGQGFEQANQTATLEKPGGIGLIGLQERLDAVGGTLEIETKPGQGVRLRGSVPWPKKV